MSQQSLTNGSSETTHQTKSETGILVGLPAYNEEIGIGSVILAAEEFGDEVVVVDDGSSDRTVEIAESAGATVIVHETNKGKGGAVKTLLQVAAEREPDALVLLDADGQHVPGNITDVAQPVLDGDADIVIGSRYLEANPDDETPAYRRFGQRVLDFLTTGRSARHLTDTQSGFRAFSPQAVRELELTTNGIGVETEMIRDASDKGLKMTEVPIDVRYEGIDGQTYNPLHHGLTVVNFVLKLIRDRHPLVFFTLPGLLLVFLGSLYGLDGILVYRATGEFYPAKVLVAGFATILGSLAAFTGMMLNSLSNKLAQVSNTQ